MIVILTLSEDLHALEVKSAAAGMGYNKMHIVESDRISSEGLLGLRIGRTARDVSAYLTSNEGARIDLADALAVWVRRPRAEQVSISATNPKEKEFINNECRAGITGVLSSSGFHGKWVSHPDATLRACDKICQLQIAQQCGFRVPKTLVSQSKREVVDFYEACDGSIIVKPLLGVAEPFLVTRQMTDPYSLSEEAYLSCPAIYQELIPGTKHIRLNCFGPAHFAALIESQDLDWRPNLNVPISAWPVPTVVGNRALKVIETLGLAMGIIDLKITPEGEIVWLEINPQGQFLFLEPFLKVKLSCHFARFLIDCAEASCSR